MFPSSEACVLWLWPEIHRAVGANDPRDGCVKRRLFGDILEKLGERSQGAVISRVACVVSTFAGSQDLFCMAELSYYAGARLCLFPLRLYHEGIQRSIVMGRSL